MDEPDQFGDCPGAAAGVGGAGTRRPVDRDHRAACPGHPYGVLGRGRDVDFKPRHPPLLDADDGQSDCIPYSRHIAGAVGPDGACAAHLGGLGHLSHIHRPIQRLPRPRLARDNEAAMDLGEETRLCQSDYLLDLLAQAITPAPIRGGCAGARTSARGRALAISLRKGRRMASPARNTPPAYDTLWTSPSNASSAATALGIDLARDHPDVRDTEETAHRDREGCDRSGAVVLA